MCSTIRLHWIYGSQCLEERTSMLPPHMKTLHTHPMSISTALVNLTTHCEYLSPVFQMFIHCISCFLGRLFYYYFYALMMIDVNVNCLLYRVLECHVRRL